MSGFRSTSPQAQRRSKVFIPCQEFNSTCQHPLTTLSGNEHFRSDCLMHRFVSITLIIAVLQCTFSCTVGSCCAVDSESSVKAHRAKSCCSHCQRVADSSSPLRGDSKTGNPHESNDGHESDPCSCQGACAGMVPCRHVELKAAPNSFPLSLILELPVSMGCSGLDSRATEDDASNQRTAHGLSMRIRVCSLTC